MRKSAFYQLLGNSGAARPTRGAGARAARPQVEALEGRSLLTATVISGVQQYGVPSLLAIDQSQNLYYNFLTEESGMTVWNGWTAVPGGSGAIAISTGTVLVSPVVRPYVVLLNSIGNIYYNVNRGGANWGGWSEVGINVGADAISSGVLPVANKAFVFLINGLQNVYYSEQTASGQFSTWSPVGVGVGALSIATGSIQVSSSPAIFEPYVFMSNGADNVYYSQRNTDGTWTTWSPVGINVGAVSISAVTQGTVPYVVMQNGAGNVYLNYKHANGTFAGWYPVGSGGGGTPSVQISAIASDHTIYTFSRNSSSQLYSTYGGAGTTVAWFGLGALASLVDATTISAASDPTSAPLAFSIGTDGNVYFNDQLSWATWNTWVSIGTPS